MMKTSILTSKFSCKKIIATLFLLLIAQFYVVDLSAQIPGSQSEILKKSQEENLAKDPYWTMLLHYKNGNSIVRSEDFFLAKDGKKDLKSELNATIKAFFDKNLSLKNNHAICRFPARLKWLQERLGLLPSILPKVKCNKLKEFQYNLSADSVDVVFASESSSSIISMMGHIFLKISGKRGDGRVEYSLGYFAKFSKKAPFLSAMASVYPGIRGLYVLEPYRKKLYEYNDVKKRNIWEYKMNLSQGQINSLVLHLWELKDIDVEYEFIGHNCGSALLYLLYLADPRIEDVKKINPLDSPIDIIKDLNDANYISGVELLPEDSYKMRMIEDNFGHKEKSQIKKGVLKGDVDFLKDYKLSDQKKANLVSGLQNFANVKLLDGSIDQRKYDKLQEYLDVEERSLPKNNLIYDIRNSLNRMDSSRVDIGYADQSDIDDGVVNFGFKPVYNDLISNSSGYFNEMELSLASFKGKYYIDDKKMYLDNFDLIKMKNIVPNKYLAGGSSGSFKVNLERQSLYNDSGKMFANAEFKAGLASNFLSNVLAYSLVGGGYSTFKDDGVFYINPEVGLIYRLPKDIGKINLNYTRFFADDDYKYYDLFTIDQSLFLNKSTNLVFSYKYIKTEFEGNVRQLEVNSYYYF